MEISYCGVFLWFQSLGFHSGGLGNASVSSVAGTMGVYHHAGIIFVLFKQTGFQHVD